MYCSTARYLNQSAATRAGEPGSINSNILKGFAKDGTSYNVGNAKKYGFGVFAYYTGKDTYGQYQKGTYTAETSGVSTADHVANFMFNQQVFFDQNSNYEGYVNGEKIGSDFYTWYYTPIKYWPNEVTDDKDKGVDDQDNDANTNAAYTDYTNGGNLSFFAYAPYVTLSETELTGKGITAINGKTKLSDANKVEGDPIISYEIDTDGKTVDLLWGTYDGTDVNVNNEENGGVAGDNDKTNDFNSPRTYEQSILGTYKLNANLTKQKTNGKVGFAFKHALAKIGGSKEYSADPGSPSNYGFMVVLDLDDMKGAEVGGKLEEEGNADQKTKVTISEINVDARALVADASGNKPGDTGYEYTYLKVAKGNFNLATGQWEIIKDNTPETPSDYDNVDTNPATTTPVNHKITTAGTGEAGKLNENIAEPATVDKTEAGFTSLKKGVLTTPQNVYATEDYPLVYIPGTWPELTVTVTYVVRTKDTNLNDTYSEVKQKITKRVTFKDAVELNKQYSLLMHLGLTSVKFTAEVSNWDVDNNAPNYDSDNDGDVDIEVTDVYVPINVAGLVSATAANSTSAESNATSIDLGVITLNYSDGTTHTTSDVTPTFKLDGSDVTNPITSSGAVEITLTSNAELSQKNHTLEIIYGGQSTTLTITQKARTLTSTFSITGATTTAITTTEPRYTVKESDGTDAETNVDGTTPSYQIVIDDGDPQPVTDLNDLSSFSLTTGQKVKIIATYTAGSYGSQTVTSNEVTLE